MQRVVLAHVVALVFLASLSGKQHRSGKRDRRIAGSSMRCIAKLGRV